jgi:putative peptidoglycan lipid II flippase
MQRLSALDRGRKMGASSIAISARNVNRRILSAAVTVTAAGVIVKLAAVLKEVTVAGIYGRSDSMDAYLAALLLPGLLVNLIAESMNQALTPTLIRVRETQNHARAQELLSNAMLWSCGLLILVSASMALCARSIFSLTASHFEPEKMTLAIHLFYGLLPIVLLTGIASNCAAVLNTVECFAAPALVPLTTSLTIIGCSLVLGAQIGIWAIVCGSLAGALIQAIWMSWLTNQGGYRIRLRWYGMNAATREVAHQYGPVLLSSVVASGGLLVDQSMAAMLPSGSVSTLAYATRFVSVAGALLSGTVSSAITPYLSSMVAQKDWRRCRQTVRNWTRVMALVSIPITAILIAGSHFLVRIALQHGRFWSDDTAAVTQVMVMSAIQIPFFVCSRVPYRLILAMRRTDLILYCGLLNLVLDIVLNLVLMPRFGVAGIALSTSLWCVTTFIFLAYWSHRLLSAESRGSL